MNQLSSKLPLYHPLILFLFFLGFWMRTSDGLTEYQEYVNCSPPYSCGNLYFNFTYPFQLDDRPDYCGRPGISLSCINHNSTLLINISGKSYHVKDMDYTNQVLTIVDQAFVGQSCPQIYTNTTFDSSIFEYTDLDSNLSLYFNCTFPTPKLQEINCLQSVDGRRSYYMIEDGDSSPINMSGNCSSTAIIPVHKTVVDKLVSGHKSLGDALQEGFSVKWTDGSDECCRYCMDTGGVCGYNSSSLYSTCFYQNMTDPYCFWRNQDSFNFWLTIIIVVAIFLLVCTWFAICLRCNSKFRNSFIFWMKKSRSVATVEAILKTCGSLGPKRFKYSEVKKMTKSFNDKLGQGGFGTVFKGMLPDGHQVAVKVLSDSKGNGEEFVNEVASIGKTSHVNIVSLLGFCSEGSKRALIFDFMPNGSLEKFIYIKNPKTVTLGWQKLYEIAIGIARGLEYLHRGCKTRIVHFDIKPHNIQLDQDFCPKISDFGLAKLCSRKESIVSMQGARGTVGYIAPEVCSRSFGVVSSKSDVYSYGMMILEMVGGRKNVDVEVEKSSEIYFPHWVYEHLDRDGYLDACGVTTETEEIAKKMILVGLWCIQTIPGNRPSMSRVVEMFEGSIRDLQMPPKPNLYSPSEPEIARSAASMS